MILHIQNLTEILFLTENLESVRKVSMRSTWLQLKIVKITGSMVQWLMR